MAAGGNTYVNKNAPVFPPVVSAVVPAYTYLSCKQYETATGTCGGEGLLTRKRYL